MCSMIKLIQKTDSDFPPLIREIPDAPKQLYIEGNTSPLFYPQQKILCIVGARKYSNYGKEVTEKLVAGLKGYPITIVSGLALGIDSIAHRSALDAGLHTIAFPGSGLDRSVLYPPSHKKLAEEILANDGALLSEFDLLQASTPWTFPSRNRLMAGISHATLVIEAELKSGTLITSKNATEYNRDVGTIPGAIFSPLSAGPHMLIRMGATPVTCVDDLLEFLGFARHEGQSSLALDDARLATLGTYEKKIMEILRMGPTNKDTLVREIGLETHKANMIISSLELDGFIVEEGEMMRVM